MSKEKSAIAGSKARREARDCMFLFDMPCVAASAVRDAFHCQRLASVVVGCKQYEEDLHSRIKKTY
jgi:hypothetical protein